MIRLTTVFLVLFSFLRLSGQNDVKEFSESLRTFYHQYTMENLVNYSELRANNSFDSLVNQMSQIHSVSADERTAFLANCYNLTVISKVVKHYPIESVMKVRGFFTEEDFTILGTNYSLNSLEKEILNASEDPRFHLSLNCGALSCPPVSFHAHENAILNSQLESQSTQAINDGGFIRSDSNGVKISEIFKWYRDDFGKGNLVDFINAFRKQAISGPLGYYNYDWSLNELAINRPGGPTNTSRYVVSNTIREGTTETKIFNNLYSEHNDEVRVNYWTTQVGFLYGLTDNFNLGFDLRYRAVQQNDNPSNPLNIFKPAFDDISRHTVSTIGPKIRWTPLPDPLPRVSIQSAYWIPTGNKLENADGRLFLDWDGATWWTQFFYDKNVGSSFSLFTELDVVLEDIGKGDLNRLSTPASAILSYFPRPEITTYFLVNGSVSYEKPLGGFFQFGGGAKYQFSSNFEVELLYTKFYNGGDRAASTYNLGIRINS